jgi:hypothetical protein
MDHFLLRDAGGMNPLGVGEPLAGLFWGPHVPFFTPPALPQNANLAGTFGADSRVLGQARGGRLCTKTRPCTKTPRAAPQSRLNLFGTIVAKTSYFS